jgi:hypothetical protein
VAANGGLTDKTPIKLSVTVLLSLLIGTGSGVASVYAMKDQTKIEMREEREVALRQYVTWEKFREWEIQENRLRDAEFRAILDRISDLKATR